MPPPTASKNNPFKDFNVPDLAATTIAVGAEAGNVIQVTITAKRPGRGAFTRVVPFTVIVSDSATNGAPAAAAPSGGVVVGVGTQLAADVAGKVIRALTSTGGVLRLDITEAAAKTFYVHVMGPNGQWKVSPAVTFV